jgi:SAM-dependent methyltransferase
MDDARNTLRATFDGAALLYDAVRPGYPGALVADVVALSGVPPGGRILEIGCGTGQATLPFARRGYRVLCVELGASLAAVARRNLAAYPDVRATTGAFEDWPVEERAFDLALSATAFHWLDPAVAYPKIHRALRPAGSLALFWNTHVRSDRDAGFFDAVQEVYEREAPELTQGVGPLPGPDDVADTSAEIEQTGLFTDVRTRRYAWHAEYDARTYTRLLGTYSGHRALDPDTRARLFAGIAHLMETEYGGRVTKGYLAVLYVAHRAP